MNGSTTLTDFERLNDVNLWAESCMRFLKSTMGWRITKHEEPSPKLPKLSDWYDEAEDEWEVALDKVRPR